MIATAPQWMPHPRADLERARSLARELGAPLPVAHALVNRGLRAAEEARRFLDPSLDDLHDPFLLKDLDRAVERIRRAIGDGERILIHGDYDVDGITAAHLLFTLLGRLGARVGYYIPHRTRDGYGLTDSSIEAAKRRACTLIVTVDCGITAVEPVANARRLGIDTVITDHHEPPDSLPDAAALVNPWRAGCPYPFKHLSGVGVAFKLAQGLVRDHGNLDWALEHLDAVAIGTIADVVPLTGENRVLARLGLERLNRSPAIGLAALIEVTGLAGKPVSSAQVGFVLAPRINAAGRVGSAELGMKLLQATDRDAARQLARRLEVHNETRRRLDEQALEDAVGRVEAELRWPDCSSILLWSDTWHPGVIGIVASRLVERFQRPTILVALEGEWGRGSGRGWPGLDLGELLHECEDLLESHGGHAFAAGLTVKRDRLVEFRQRLEAGVRTRIAPEAFVSRVLIDADVEVAECDPHLVEWIQRLAPFGLGNPEPLFRAENVTVQSAAVVGAGKHLRLRVRDRSGAAQAIAFGFGERLDSVRAARRCDLAFFPTRDDWMGETRIQLKVKGVRTL